MGQVDLIAALNIYRDDILRFLRARAASDQDAQDLASELYLKLQAFEPKTPIENPRSYLFSMANRLVLDRLRETVRRARREATWARETAENPDFIEKDHRSDPEHFLIAEDEAHYLRLAIADLPPGARRVLILHKVDGASHAEIAEQLGITRSAVEKHMAVAMRHLRKRLGGLR